MLILVNFLLLFSVAEVLLRKTSPDLNTKKIKDNGSEYKLQNASGTRKSSEEAASTDRLSILTNFGESGTKNDTDRGGRMLEHCYGRIGRWLSSRSKETRDRTKGQKCCCECCGEPISDRSSKRQTVGKDSKKCCFHVKEVDCDVNSKHQGEGKRCFHVTEISSDGSSNIGLSKEAMRFSEAGAKDSKLSLFRSASTGAEATPGFVIDSNCNVVSTTVQCPKGQELKVLRRTVDETSKSGWEENTCCFSMLCYMCCPKKFYYCSGYTLAALLCGPVWLVDQGLRFFCKQCCMGLNKCLTSCFGKNTESQNSFKADLRVKRMPGLM